jgi:hypothetical protein
LADGKEHGTAEAQRTRRFLEEKRERKSKFGVVLKIGLDTGKAFL